MSNGDYDNTSAAAGELIRDLTREAAIPRVVELEDGRQFLAHPNDVILKEVTDPHGLIITPPARIVASVHVQTADSLVEYVNRFKQSGTLILADIGANTIRASIDYHDPDLGPQHLQHGAKLELPFSEEWRTWTAAHGKMVDQLAFARFIEENAADVEAPAAADLLEMVRDLHAVRKVNFTKAVRTATDNENFEYTDETEARSRGGVELPKAFKLRIPVYFDGAQVALMAFLRWKLDDGKLLLGVALHRHEHVRQAVFKQVVADVADRTAVPHVYGKVA